MTATRVTPLEHALAAAGFMRGEPFELCALVKNGTRAAPVARRFHVGDGAAEAWLESEAARLSGKRGEGGLYLGLSPLATAQGGRARDDEAAAVRVLLVDADPDDTTPAARAAAAELADAARALLGARLGVRPALVDSGRGRQVWLRHEAAGPGDERASGLRRRLLAALARRLDRPGAHVDVAVHNASRLARMPGTANLRTGEFARVLDAGDGRAASLDALEALVDELERVEAEPATAEAEDAQSLPPFPLEALPPAVANLWGAFALEQAAQVELAVLPGLAAAATALGSRWRCGAPPAFVRAPLLWFAAAAPSGAGKSPTADPILWPVRAHDVRQREEHDLEHGRWKAREQARRRRKGPADDEEGLDAEPKRRKVYLTNATPEALTADLATAQGRGVLLHSDELGTLLDSLDGYRAGGGRQGRGMVLSLWNGGAVRQSRRSGGDVEADSTHLGVYAGIQPSTLRKLALRDEDGLAPRFLWAHVPFVPRGEGEEAGRDLRVEWQGLFARLLELGEHEREPMLVDAAGRALVAEENLRGTTLAGELDEAGLGLQSGFYGKHGDQLVRLVALLHGLDVALGARPGLIPCATVERAALLARYFLAHGLEVARMVVRPGEAPPPTLSAEDSETALALLRILVPGQRLEDTAAGWAKRLAAAGRPGLRPEAAGRALLRLQTQGADGLAVERPNRGAGGKRWAVARPR